MSVSGAGVNDTIRAWAWDLGATRVFCFVLFVAWCRRRVSIRRRHDGASSVWGWWLSSGAVAVGCGHG